MRTSELKIEIVRSLTKQGFRFDGDRICPPEDLNKDKIRDIHKTAVSHKIEMASKHLRTHESQLLRRLAEGSTLSPEGISPRLVRVEAGSEDELLFRYVGLHWSIPVSSGYGRRLRFLVIDEQNGKLIGLIGLGDPVFSVAARDEWVDWSFTDRKSRLRHVMDAFVLGAVPPYSSLLGGKLVAMLSTSDEVRKTFRSKYGGNVSLISKEPGDARLALITTTSALGRSSLYNRITMADRKLFHPVGFTQGSGDFHFANGLYAAIHSYATDNCAPTAKNTDWGVGFRNRREVVKKCLQDLGFSTEWLYHGVKREVFAVPLAHNTRDFLQGHHERLRWYGHSVSDLHEWFKHRWLLPRAGRDQSYRTFHPEQYRIWNTSRSTPFKALHVPDIHIGLLQQ